MSDRFKKYDDRDLDTYSGIDKLSISDAKRAIDVMLDQLTTAISAYQARIDEAEWARSDISEFASRNYTGEANNDINAADFSIENRCDAYKAKIKFLEETYKSGFDFVCNLSFLSNKVQEEDDDDE